MELPNVAIRDLYWRLNIIGSQVQKQGKKWGVKK